MIGLTFPFRVAAQTAGQGQAIGILVLLGLAPRSGAQPPAEAKKPEGAAKKVAQPPGKLRLTSDRLTGRMVVGSAEASDSRQTK